MRQRKIQIAATWISRFSDNFVRLAVPLLFISAVSAQSDQTNHRVTQGEVSDNATISLSVPLMDYPGRGLNLPVTLNYSSSVWRLEHWKSVKYYPPGYAGYIKQSVTYPIYSEYATAGWTSSLSLPIVEWPKATDTYDYKGKPSESYSFRIAKVTIRMPDGSSHELRKSDVPFSGQIDMSGVFYSIDGSRMRYDSVDQDTGTLFMPDGTRYVLDAGTCQIIDRHGNQVSYELYQWTDTLGRHLTNPIPSNPQAQDYTYYLPGLAGVNGGAQGYTFKWRNLADALTPEGGSTPALRVIASHYLPTPSSAPSDSNQSNYPQAQSGTYQSLFQTAYPSYETGEEPDNPVPTMVVGYGYAAGQLFNPVVLTEIVLPDGTSYKFGYNVYGEINKVTYPTGAYDQYEYAATITEADGFRQPYTQAERNITSRKQSIDGTGGDIREWTYAESQGWSPIKTISIVAPDTTKTEIYQYQPWVASDPDTTFAPFGLGDSTTGSTIERRVYSSIATGRTLLRRELTSYEQSSNAFNWPAPGINPPYIKALNARRNPRPARTTSLIFEGPGSALAQSSTFQYDATNQFTTGVDQTQAAVYHFAVVDNATAQSGSISQIPLGNLARYTETSYLNDSVYRNANILGTPNVTAIKDSSGTIVSRSEMVYDECPQYCSTTGRALPTSMKTWDSTKGSDPANPANQLVTHAKFDQWGNRTEATDAKGFVTTTVYDTNYQTFPVQVISPVPDPTGTHGSSTSFTTTTTYDTPAPNRPPLGLVVATTDANGQTTTISYVDPVTGLGDPLLRPRKVTAPNGHQTITEYGAGTSETTRWVKVRTQIDNEKWSEAISKYDGLGRTYLTEKIDSQGSIFTETEYDMMGRVKRSTNPYKSGETKQWTTPEYDDLSRTKKVISPDTDDVQITYALSTEDVIGTKKTITDQAGRERTGVTDALGNMVRVYEGPVATNQFTDYVFDTLGNLRKTIQGEQSRYFMYDSLGRVLFGKQPEQDTNAAFTATDPITANTAWSVRYSYDDNGNILTTTDARNISIAGSYDNLNRLTFRNYSDATPDVDFFYDGTGLGISPPNFSKGKTTRVASSVSESRNTSFDQMGRLLTSEQRTTAEQLAGTQAPYSFSYAYNLSGALIEETYPSGRVVKNTLNADGELSQVQSRKNGNFGYHTYADAFTFNSAGAVTKMQLGNGRWETASYNERLQVTQIGLGVTSNDQNLLKLEFKYNTPNQADNNGSMREQKITVPTVGTNPGFTATQSYVYDSLNRIKSATENLTPIGGTSTQTWKRHSTTIDTAIEDSMRRTRQHSEPATPLSAIRRSTPRTIASRKIRLAGPRWITITIRTVLW